MRGARQHGASREGSGVSTDDDAADTLRDEELAATHDDVLEAKIRDRLKEVHVALPGFIQSFDATKQTAVVQPAINRIWIADDDGNGGGSIPIPLCSDVPVQFPRGGNGILTFPVAAGDECLLVFAERAIDNWWANGGKQDPSEFRMHDYSDGFALLGFSSVPRVVTNISTDGVELRTLDGQTMFRLEAGVAYVGGKAGSERSVMGETYRQGESTMNTSVATAIEALLVAAGTIDPAELLVFTALYPTISKAIVAMFAFFPVWLPLLQAFETQAPLYLAKQAKVR